MFHGLDDVDDISDEPLVSMYKDLVEKQKTESSAA